MCCLLVWVGVAQPIDNPDAPDRIGAFNARAAPFEERLNTLDGGGRAVAEGAAYVRFLDVELNRAYRTRLTHLDPEPRKALALSQRRFNPA